MHHNFLHLTFNAFAQIFPNPIDFEEISLNLAEFTLKILIVIT